MYMKDKPYHVLRAFAKKRCGNCFYWMKRGSCPKEKNVNGYNRGPSIDAPPCSKFERDWLSQEAFEELYHRERQSE